MTRHNDTVCSKYNEPVLPDEKGNCSLCGAELCPVTKQKDIEDFLTGLGFEPTDEYEEFGVMFTKYEAEGIGVRIERNLPPTVEEKTIKKLIDEIHFLENDTTYDIDEDHKAERLRILAEKNKELNDMIPF